MLHEKLKAILIFLFFQGGEVPTHNTNPTSTPPPIWYQYQLEKDYFLNFLLQVENHKIHNSFLLYMLFHLFKRSLDYIKF